MKKVSKFFTNNYFLALISLECGKLIKDILEENNVTKSANSLIAVIRDMHECSMFSKKINIEKRSIKKCYNSKMPDEKIIIYKLLKIQEASNNAIQHGLKGRSSENGKIYEYEIIKAFKESIYMLMCVYAKEIDVKVWNEQMILKIQDDILQKYIKASEKNKLKDR